MVHHPARRRVLRASRGQDQGSHIDACIDASPHACFTRGQKVEFSINTSGISQAFTIMMALATSTRAAEHRLRARHRLRLLHVRRRAEPEEAAWGSAAKTAMNIKKLSVCQNTGYQNILVADDATGELKTTKQNSGGQVIYGQQGGFGAATTKAMAKGDPFQIYGYWRQTSEPSSPSRAATRSSKASRTWTSS